MIALLNGDPHTRYTEKIYLRFKHNNIIVKPFSYSFKQFGFAKVSE